MSSPSSVNVPVLSKQQTLIFPATFILLGEMQKMPDRRRRFRAKLVPIESVAGSAGGTTTVIRSSARIRIVCHRTCALELNATMGMVNKGTYSKLYKLHSASAETKPRDSRKDHDKTN